MNKVTIIGRLVKDLELNGEKKVANFAVAVAGSKDHTDFIPCVSFGKTSELISKYVHKGERVAVNGSISVDQYTDKENNKRTSVKVVVDSVEFIENKPKEDVNDAFTS